MTGPLRRFVDVDGRRVHYRVQGSGPPLVLLHGSPGDSQVLLGEMAAAAPFFTCYGFDTPGFGFSEPIAREIITVRDLARATAEAMAALKLGPCLVFGTHSGAAIGLELGASWPERVSGLVLDAVPIFSAAEAASVFQGAFTGSSPDPLGGHLTSTWMRFRDQFTWFPWSARDVTRLNANDRPTAADVDLWVSMYYRARRTFAAPYRAVMTYGMAAVETAATLERPAVFLATEDDMLFTHLDRLPPLKPGQSIARLAPGAEAKHRRIVHHLRGLAASEPVTPASKPGRPVGRDGGLQVIDAPHGQVFVRAYGRETDPTLLLLHDAPGTSLSLDGVARDLAKSFHVIAPDLPGAGLSDPGRTGQSCLGAGADAITAVLDWTGCNQVKIAGAGCGAAVALTFADRSDPRLVGMVLDDLPHADAQISEAIAPDLPLSPEGAHWIKAWLMVRDGQIYKPWFDGRVAAQRQTQGHFDAEWLHEQTVALMHARAHYAALPREGALFDGPNAMIRHARLARLRPPGRWAETFLAA